ncbi:MAG: AMP-binding protein [Gammaproteobacteria bacterium]|nr:AMP-binding protein [Gammaproteobacteria bacterium]
MSAKPEGTGDSSRFDTIPKLLLEHARVRPDRAAIREKDFGIWQSWSWSQARDEIMALAGGLADMGFEAGDKLAIVGDNRPQLYWAMVAAQIAGGVPVPVYQDSVAEEMQYIFDHAGIRFAVVEDQEQVDKLLEVKAGCESLAHIVYEETRGMRDYEQTFLHALGEVQARGRTWLQAHADELEQRIANGKGDDLAIMLYTSGTTGRPKGVELSHDNLLVTARNAAEFDHLTANEEMVSYLPMAWVGDCIFSLAQAYVCGFCINCPESGDTVMTDMREIGPTYFFAPPAIFENLLTNVSIRIEDASAIKQWLYKHYIDVARHVGVRILEGEPVSAWERFEYFLGSLLVYGPLKNVLGFSKVRVAYTAGEAIGPEIFDFYRGLGMNIKQLYGQTEASVFITMHPDGEVKPDTVGVPAPGVEVKITDSGEVLYRSPGVFMRYHKNEEATAETKTPDGWVMTGDAGYFGEDGHLRIIDRAKDVGKLNDGSMFAPKFLENKLKFFPQIKEVVAFGHERDFVAAFINIDLEAVGNWAERNGIAYSGYTDLAGRAEVYDQIQACVEKVNEDLADDPHLSGSQIHRFLILHKELDADDGELTRTRKVRRRIIAERYGDLIEALYDGRDEVHVEAEVTFEDGRKGKIVADLKIRDTKTVEVREAAA